MARNAITPIVPSQIPPTTANAQCHSIPSIRIERPSKDEVTLEIQPDPKPAPPPRGCTLGSNLQHPRTQRVPRTTSLRPYTNGNGVMKNSARETMVTMGFTEEQVPPSHYCCGSCKIEKICKAVGVLSMIGFVINIVLYFMGYSKLGLNGYFEAFLLIFDFVAIFTLLCGTSKQRSGLLKPYLFYNTLWNIGLIILFTVFIYNVLKGTQDISRNLLDTIRALRSNPDEYHFRQHYSSSMAVVVTILVMAAMTTLIVINCIFLHIVYRAFQLFAHQEDRQRDELEKKERL